LILANVKRIRASRSSARMEKLIGQVRYQFLIALHNTTQKQFGERWGLIERPPDNCLVEPRDLTDTRSRSRRISLQISVQASLAEEVVVAENCDHGFLADCGIDRNFHGSADDVEKRISRVTLAVNDLAIAVFRYGSAAILGDERSIVELIARIVSHNPTFPCLRFAPVVSA